MKTVTSYQCERCSSIHRLPADAEECCTCKKCGTPFKKRADVMTTKCDHCFYGERLRYQRGEIKRHRERLVSAEEHLAKLLAEGRPPKGTI